MRYAVSKDNGPPQDGQGVSWRALDEGMEPEPFEEVLEDWQMEGVGAEDVWDGKNKKPRKKTAKEKQQQGGGA